MPQSPQVQRPDQPTAITGHVIARDGRPLANAELSIEGKLVARTESDGFFSINAPGKSRRLAVTFSRDGFVTNTRVFPPSAGRGNIIVIWPIANRVRFEPGCDLDVQFAGGRIRIPAQAIETDRGKPVARAELRFTWFDVTNARDRAAASGDFSGRFADGSIRRLDSYGIFDLDIVAEGARLRLRRGAQIGLTIEIPERLRKRAPRKIGYFDFDQATGVWVEAGTFELADDGLTYNGHVVSFGGSHNLDDPGDTTCITVQVINAWSSAPMAGMTVVAHGLQYDSYGTTNANGYVCLLVQKNASFSVEAYGSIGNSFWSTPPWLHPTFNSPNFSSGAADCGDPAKCPLLGSVPVDLIVGISATAVAAQLPRS